MQRKFILGSEWLYCKIYCSFSKQQDLLQSDVAHLVRELRLNGWISKFFFIRFKDEQGCHLRLRFHLIQVDDFTKVVILIRDMFSQAVEKREILDIQYSTYFRELERYGSSNIEDIEELFSINSFQILDLIAEHTSSRGDWLRVAALANDLLDNAGLNFSQRHSICEELFAFYKKKLQPSRSYMEFLRTQQRTNKNDLLEYLSQTSSNLHKQREVQHRLLIQIHSRCQQDCNENLYTGIIKSLIHMMMNRYFVTDQNIVELVLYYMLSHHYHSLFKRSAVQI
ncbi:hypothetical protein ASE74_10110 [Pedobacter sp. Leaf216]|uniref:thiopeptide-type bacteriocin biosynthesis protein n=1 Tax=Pedobacter sp. Leaf216 TaxID=1735684 RepID=UPI0006F447A4|nr:thiopeptide-type bacteriocin biosynthesis protein [Pedobacter sp. Leaf216]KQM65215.1 hypothetical protein ASE74_10110 [Pedobacter sp. Leaf216]